MEHQDRTFHSTTEKQDRRTYYGPIDLGLGNGSLPVLVRYGGDLPRMV